MIWIYTELIWFGAHRKSTQSSFFKIRDKSELFVELIDFQNMRLEINMDLCPTYHDALWWYRNIFILNANLNYVNWWEEIKSRDWYFISVEHIA